MQNKTGNIFYEIEGKGYPVFLVHGFCEDHTIWDEFKQPLLDKYRVITPDLPGFGKSELGSVTDIAGMADTVKQIVEKENLQKIILIGHSMGGYVTLAFTEKYPELLSGICLFHSICFADDEAKKENRKKVADFVLKYGSPPLITELYGTLFTKDFISKNQAIVDNLISRFSKFSPESIAAASMAMRNRPDRSQVLQQINLPVQFIVGKYDGVFTLQRSMEMTHLPDTADITLLENSAHMGMYEEKEKSQQAVLNWLQQIDYNN